MDINGPTSAENNRSAEPSLVESSGNKQLKKLLAKEEQRLEQEQKRGAIARRRKQQQEQFQLQHELNHPLRQHHAPQSTKLVEGEFLGVLLQLLLRCNGCNTLELPVLLSESACVYWLHASVCTIDSQRTLYTTIDHLCPYSDGRSILTSNMKCRLKAQYWKPISRIR